MDTFDLSETLGLTDVFLYTEVASAKWITDEDIENDYTDMDTPLLNLCLPPTVTNLNVWYDDWTVLLSDISTIRSLSL